MIFISYNKFDSDFSAQFANMLIKQGENVWIDKWNIHPGDSIIGGMGEGIKNANIFIIIWSKNAFCSKWVSAEINSIIRRRIDDNSLKIIPIMLDETPLPVLIAEFSGFIIDKDTDLDIVTSAICGSKSTNEKIISLQNYLEELAGEPVISYGGFNLYCCPKCSSKNLIGKESTEYEYDRSYFSVICKDCGWTDSSEI